MKDAKELYEGLKKKYSLPEFGELQKNFSIGKIEEENNIFGEIIKKIDDRADLFLKIITRIIQPDTLISDIHESSVFTENEKKSMFELYKKLMIMHNNALLLEIGPEEKSEADFIKETAKEWAAIRKEISGIVTKMRDSWKQDIDLKEDLGYMG